MDLCIIVGFTSNTYNSAVTLWMGRIVVKDIFLRLEEPILVLRYNIWDECLGVSLSCRVEKSGIGSWGVGMEEMELMHIVGLIPEKVTCLG